MSLQINNQSRAQQQVIYYLKYYQKGTYHFEIERGKINNYGLPKEFASVEAVKSYSKANNYKALIVKKTPEYVEEIKIL